LFMVAAHHSPKSIDPFLSTSAALKNCLASNTTVS